MFSPSLESPAPERLRIPGGTRGFTLLELSLSLLVAALAVGVLLAGLDRWRHQARCVAVGRDLQAFAVIMEKARAEHGRWPEAPEQAGPGLQERGWSAASPVGGAYGWVPPAAPGQPGRITLTAFHPAFPLAITRAELRELDRRIDDGDLATGRLRTGFNGWPVYLVGDRP